MLLEGKKEKLLISSRDVKYVVIIFIVVVSSETIIEECDSTHKGNILIIEAHYLTYFNFFCCFAS